MTHGDPRGPNIIPFGRRTLNKLRAITQDRPAPSLRPLPLVSERFSTRPVQNEPDSGKPWPFNALGPSPYHRSTLPPVAADRTQNGAGRTQFGDDTFSFKDMSDSQFNIELAIEGALADHQLAYPRTTPLELVAALLCVTKKILQMAKLPSR